MQITSIKMLVILLALNLLMLTKLGGLILTITLVSIIGIPIALILMALPSITAFLCVIFVLENFAQMKLSAKHVVGLALVLIVGAFVVGQLAGHFAFLPHIALERMMSSDMQFGWWLDPF